MTIKQLRVVREIVQRTSNPRILIALWRAIEGEIDLTTSTVKPSRYRDKDTAHIQDSINRVESEGGQR